MSAQWRHTSGRGGEPYDPRQTPTATMHKPTVTTPSAERWVKLAECEVLMTTLGAYKLRCKALGVEKEIIIWITRNQTQRCGDDLLVDAWFAQRNELEVKK